jgi:hypothetical protein
MRPLPQTAVSLAALALAFGLSTGPLAAWTPETQVLIGENAASIAPPDLARQIDRHRRAFRRGLLTPFESADGRAHSQNGSDGGDLEASLHRAIESAVAGIRHHQPFPEIVHRLGVVSHFVADVGNPLNTSDIDPREPDYFVDYLRYVEWASGRYPLVFYAEGRDLTNEGDLRLLIAHSLHRGRQLYPLIGREYERVGRVDGRELFDDRSTAFGVGSVAISHAISDAAAVLRYIWLQAGGGDSRRLGLTRPLPSASPAAHSR